MILRTRHVLLALEAMIGIVSRVGAQAVQGDPAVLALPRPGYEPRALADGATELRLQGDLVLAYDNNVYAAPAGREGDAMVQPTARLSFSRADARVRTDADAHVARTQFFRLSRENSTTFGLSAHGQVATGSRLYGGQVFYDRVVESRADPEAPPAGQRPPRRIDTAGVDARYAIRGSFVSVDLAGGWRVFNYLAREEDDRDLQSFESNARFSYRVAGATSLFVEPYFVRRQFSRRVDFSGVDRDATTLGVLAGLSRDVSAKLSGRVGVGLYRFNPDDRGLPPDTGIAAQGTLVWAPRRRTNWTLDLMSGDAATVRAGATGRQDVRAALRLDQEIRHNLLFAGDVSWSRNKYRAAADLDRTTAQASAELTLLMTRAFGLVARASYMHRTATDPRNAFDRTILSIGVRWRR
jgi:hypothetical protein